MYKVVPASELENRIARLRALMELSGIDLSLIIYGPDLFYFTGIIQQGVLAVPLSGEALFFVRRNYRRATEETPLKNVIEIESPGDMKRYDFGLNRKPLKVGFELDVMPVNFFRRFEGFFDGSAIVDVSPHIRKVRSVKSKIEIESMRESGRRLVGLIRKAGELIGKGKSEIEVLSGLIDTAITGGHTGSIKMRSWNQDVSFGHVLSGKSACVASYTDTPLGGKGRHPSFPKGSSGNLIGAGEPVIVDMMWVHEGYATDMTRIHSVGNMRDEEMLRAHSVSMDILRNAEGSIREGESSLKIFEESKNIASGAGLGDYFMGAPGSNIRFMGHGIGVELDEYPFVAEGHDFTLEAGNTFALEPKFVVPGKGAVGVENTYLVTASGFENLTEMEEEIIVI